MSYQFKTGDKCKTRDGRNARVIADDVNTDQGKALAVVVTADNGNESVGIRYCDGRLYFTENTASDLMPPKVKLTLWYKDGQVRNQHKLDDHRVNEEQGWREITMGEVDV